MAKKQIRVSIDKELYDEAKRLKMNIAGACEWGIKQRAKALKALNGIEDMEAA